MKKIKLTRELKIALIFIFALFVFVWGFNYLKGRDLLQKTRKFYADYENVSGLMAANPVLYNGFRIGIVTDMFFADDNSGKVRVEFTIDKDLDIQKNSVARIISSDLLGSKAIQIVQGDGSLAKSGDILIGETQGDLLDDIAPIAEKAESVLEKIDSIVLAVNNVLNVETQNNIIESIESLSSTLASINGTLTAVEKEKKALTDIIKNVNSITENITQNNVRIDNAIKNFSNISDTIANAKIAETINNLSETFNELTATLNKVNNGEGTLGQFASNDSLYLHLQNASENLELLLKDLKENPKRYVHFSLFGRKEKKNK